jgi:sugar diacid utilization regulator
LANSSATPLTAISASALSTAAADYRLALAVRLGREIVGYLVLPAERELAPVDRALAEIAVSGVALEFAKLRAASEVEHRLGGEVALDLITGSFSSADAIDARCARLGFDLGQPRAVLVFRVARRPARETDAAAEADLRRRSLEMMRDELGRRAPGSMIVAHGELIVVLAAARDTAHGRDMAVRLRDHLRTRLPESTSAVGIGEMCARAADYAPAFALARDALELMTRLGRDETMVGARELGAYGLLIKGSNREELIAFARRTLGPLIEHDRRHGTDLLTTLRVFLDEGRVQRRAAERLIVHVNTIVYRLKRIEELLGVDLDDAGVIFDAMLALRVMDVVGEA